MFKISKKRKKSIIALEFLVGLVLSIIALVMVYKFFSQAFFNDFSNFDIAKINAEFIKEIVDHSFSSNTNNCFFMLNFVNKQFTQSDKDTKYFYVLDKDGVYILRIENNDIYTTLKNLIKSYKTDKEIYKREAVKKYFFDKKVNLKIDKTKDANFLSYLYKFLGTSSKKLDLENYNDFIVLIEDGSENFEVFYNINIKDTTIEPHGNFEKKTPETLNKESIKPNYLYLYKKKDSIDLFFSSTKLTNILALSNLCSVDAYSSSEKEKQKINELKNNFFSSNNLDLINYIVKIKINFVENNKESDETFIWDIIKNGYWYCENCKNNEYKNGNNFNKNGNCKNLIECKDLFINKIREYINENYPKKTYDIFIKEIKKRELKDENEELYFKYEDFIIPISEDELNKIKDESGKIKEGVLYKCKIDRKWYQLDDEYIILQIDNKAYFSSRNPRSYRGIWFVNFNKDRDMFMSFKTLNLEPFKRNSNENKEKYVYILGNNYKINKISCDDVTTTFNLGDNKEFYYFIIDNLPSIKTDASISNKDPYFITKSNYLNLPKK